MKIQGQMFIWLSVFILGMAIVYGVWSKEPIGTTALFLAFGLSVMIGFYLAFTANRVDAMAQDNKEADVADEAGELGFFSPHSWQPLSLAVGGAFAFLGVVFGWWLMYFSAPLLLLGLFGWVFEYYRGENRTQ
ncbi:cytochrome c oxidase subunit 4 [Streptomyces bacillaris]|uniref:Cytochrome c oxidase polypeptide 4 n=4 Tax=Streptomyces TaxID=1883 RepID=A0AAD0Q3C2_9ACTN|nr:MULTISPECIES: cytochrome c oxidase subunit 4 [Streptomyces]MYR39728.1 cytochrome c oxidase subunit 4 [Streptomyces sp. SID4944]MYT94234.1 cytochrome c oxidase subunit 4 [Streptomyces sp. SID8359]MYU00800.1 cytochrome c oxidase subunit 4 [Streptomyces sp. SID8350]NGO87915.1 cytochrome c oxidase subunit 4 [Streptomyces sp. 196(2019)]NUW19635.1 cytochrome c oxidase subunit 4 [Streptomyces roseoviolaceus]QCW77388.1 cytochrome c oxidase subunit 4 [Streptomyces sp. S6]